MNIMISNPESLHDFLYRTITTDTLADYLTAEWGHDLAVWLDGSTSIIESNIRFHKDEEPMIRIRCPGIGNLDSTVYVDGFCDEVDDHGRYVENETGRVVGYLEDVIRECCRDGDMSSDIDQLVSDLEAAFMSEVNDLQQFGRLSVSVSDQEMRD